MDKEPSTSNQSSTNLQSSFPVDLSREIKREIESSSASSTQAIQPTALQFPTADHLNPMTTEQMQNFLRSAQQQMPTAYSNTMLFGSG